MPRNRKFSTGQVPKYYQKQAKKSKILCGIRESNSCLNLGKVAFYH